MYMYQHWCYNVFTPQTPNSDKHLIFLHNTTSESHIKITTKWSQMKEALDCLTDSPCQHLVKYMEKSMKNIHIDGEVYRVKQWPKHRALSSPFFFIFFFYLPFTTKLLGKKYSCNIQQLLNMSLVFGHIDFDQHWLSNWCCAP